MPGLTKSVSCNGRSEGMRDLLEARDDVENQVHVEKVQVRKTSQDPLPPPLASFFRRNRMDLIRRPSPIMSGHSSPSEALDDDIEPNFHLQAFYKSLGIFSTSSLVMVVASLLLMTAFINLSSVNVSTNHEGHATNADERNIEETNQLNKRNVNFTFFREDSSDVSFHKFVWSQIHKHYDKDNEALDVKHTEDENDGFLSAGLVMSAFILSASALCFTVTSLQAFFISRILYLADGHDRAYKFICDSSQSRTLAIAGLFTAIPVLITSIILLIYRLSSTNSAIAIVILAAGIIVCVLFGIHNSYRWCSEERRAAQGLPVYDSHFSIPKHALLRGSPKKTQVGLLSQLVIITPVTMVIVRTQGEQKLEKIKENFVKLCELKQVSSHSLS